VAAVDGYPGVGKSTLMFDLIARITTRRPMPCEKRQGDTEIKEKTQGDKERKTSIYHPPPATRHPFQAESS
jgi:hypothetical protein